MIFSIKFKSLVNADMSRGNDAECKQIGTDSLRVFVSSYKNERRSSNDTLQYIDVVSNKRIDPVGPSVIIVFEDKVLSINQLFNIIFDSHFKTALSTCNVFIS